MSKTIITIDGQKVWATPDQVAAVQTLLETRKGGVAAVEGYQPESNWVKRPVQNIQFISRVDYGKMNARKKAALEALSINDVAASIAKEPKLASLSPSEQRELFMKALDAELSSIERTESGDRSDAHRQGHDRCYINMGAGVKANLVTVKDDAGLKQPVLTDGFPTIASILINAFFLNTTTIVEGQRKLVNSRPLTLMKKAVSYALNKPGLALKTLSLKDDNFTAIRIDHQTIIPEGLSG